MKTIIELYAFLLADEKRQAVRLFLLSTIVSLLEAMGVASVAPFIAILSNPEIVESNQALRFAFNMAEKYIGIETTQEFMVLFGVVVFCVFVGSLMARAIAFYYQTRFSLLREYSIGTRLVESYLDQPYSWFLNKNSAEITKIILSELSTVIHSGMIPMISMMANLVTTAAIVLLLLLVNPLIAVSVAVIIGCLYFLILTLLSTRIAEMGHARADANNQRYLTVNEAFNAVKEIKLGGYEKIYSQRFSNVARDFAENLAGSQALSQLPRYVVEGFAFGSVIIILTYVAFKGGDIINILPLLALFTFAGYRLMPAMQGVYRSLALLKFVAPAVRVIQAQAHSFTDKSSAARREAPKEFIFENSAIEVRDIEFGYSETATPLIQNLSLEIPFGSKVAFVGPTGSGKSTIVDLIMGLLRPDKGQVSVGGHDINDRAASSWQRLIGYVPQQIYLADDTIAANIAFGAEPSKINQSLVEESARLAQLHDFILANSSEGYSARVGERGVRLSGGQRQRLGLARALYRRPALLVLDEATSALDTVTERQVMGTVMESLKNITVVIIAHRLNTVKDCQKIFMIETGKVTDSGSYPILLERNKKFAEMVGEK